MQSVVDDRLLCVLNWIGDQTNNGDRLNMLMLQDHYVGYNSAGIKDISHIFLFQTGGFGDHTPLKLVLTNPCYTYNDNLGT